MKTAVLLSILIGFSLNSTAQTKRIAHKSHSGNMLAFDLLGPDNLGGSGDMMMPLPTPTVRTGPVEPVGVVLKDSVHAFKKEGDQFLAPTEEGIVDKDSTKNEGVNPTTIEKEKGKKQPQPSQQTGKSKKDKVDSPDSEPAPVAEKNESEVAAIAASKQSGGNSFFWLYVLLSGLAVSIFVAHVQMQKITKTV